MELRQLEYFVAVADEASFTRAAAKVHVAQPGISAQIRRLERELGQPLFDRSGRTVRLTDVGAAVLPHARAALAAVDAARSTVDEFTGLIRGHVTVGMVSSSTSGDVDLAALLADFHRDYPDVEISLFEDKADQLLDGLRGGRIDVAFVALGEQTPPGIEAVDVLRDTLVVAAGLDDALAGRKRIDLADLGDRALICLPRGSGLRAIVEAGCAGVGFTPNVAYEAGNPLVLAQLAAKGLGVAIVPESAVATNDKVHVIELTNPTMRGRIVLAWRTGGATSPAASAFLSRARALTDQL